MKLHDHVHSGLTWYLKDARGIELAKVCQHCETARWAELRATYRADVLGDANYEADEAVEDEPATPPAPC